MNRAITHRAAVLGSPIGHSRSPLLHNTGYRAAGLEHWSYGRFECIAEQLPELIGALDNSYRGFSVTMPAKFAALDFATERTDRAERIGSANTLVRIGEGVHAGWRADNTDVDGVFGAFAELDVSASLMGAHATVIGGVGGGVVGAFFGAVNLELLVAVGDAHLQPGFDGAQVLVCRTAQIGQACVVGRNEGVAQDHGSEIAERK